MSSHARSASSQPRANRASTTSRSPVQPRKQARSAEAREPLLLVLEQQPQREKRVQRPRGRLDEHVHVRVHRRERLVELHAPDGTAPLRPPSTGRYTGEATHTKGTHDSHARSCHCRCHPHPSRPPRRRPQQGAPSRDLGAPPQGPRRSATTWTRTSSTTSSTAASAKSAPSPPNLARNVVLTAGWPYTIPGVTLDRQCSSSQQAVHFAANQIGRRPRRRRRRRHRVMSQIPLGSNVGKDLGYPFTKAMRDPVRPHLPGPLRRAHRRQVGHRPRRGGRVRRREPAEGRRARRKAASSAR